MYQVRCSFLHKLQISETLAFLPLPLLWRVGGEGLSKPSPEPLLHVLHVTASGIRGGPWMCGGFYLHARHWVRETLRNSVSRHAAIQGNVVEFTICRLIPVWGRYIGSGIAVEITEKISRWQCDCLQMFFMVAVEFIKNCPPWGSVIQVELISLQINFTPIPRGGVGWGVMEYIDWCISR